MGLIDLAGCTGRDFGGAGFALAEPCTIVRARAANLPGLEAECSLDAEQRHALGELLARVRAVGATSEVVVETVAPAHVGFGSKTSLLLATAEASLRAGGFAPSRSDLVALAQRGGASGIGVNTYFVGGFVVDGGHAPAPSLDDAQRWQPSRYRGAFAGLPPVTFRCEPPATWAVYCATLADAPRLDGEQESAVFREGAPLRPEEALETLAAIYHGLIPALIEPDLSALAAALRRIQTTGFKRHEIAAQPASIGTVLSELHAGGYACGMSSMGPTVYAVAEAENVGARDAIERTLRRLGKPHRTTFEPTGRLVSHE